jgi:hypothetical protein
MDSAPATVKRISGWLVLEWLSSMTVTVQYGQDGLSGVRHFCYLKMVHTFDGRLWVRITDQETNPWSEKALDWKVAKALTFVKLAEQIGYIIYDDGPMPGEA